MNTRGSGILGRILGVSVSVLLVVGAYAQQPASGSVSATEIPRDRLIQPEQLNRELQTHEDHAPLILQVGSHVLFEEAHIPGAEYAGPDSRPAGLNLLRSRVARLPRTSAIVIYCGCCPWGHCPNIGPAWRLLHQMGFTQVRALYIADNFGADWVDRGYRVAKSQ